MTDRETAYRGLSRAAWGYFFLFFNLNLGTLNVLPNFAGWLLLRSACTRLVPLRRDLALLRPLCMLLAAWNGVDWVLALFSGEPGGWLFPLSVLAGVVTLYFHFQFLTDMAVLAEAHQPEGDGLDRRLRRRRTVLVVAATAASPLAAVAEQLPEDVRTAAAFLLVVVGCGAALLVMLALFALRRCFREEGPA